MLTDAELHRHYERVLAEADTILFGRTTVQSMEYWKGVVENRTGNEADDGFAVTMDRISKVVFSVRGL